MRSPSAARTVGCREHTSLARCGYISLQEKRMLRSLLRHLLVVLLCQLVAVVA